MKFFCFQIGEPVHEERDAPSLTAPSPHPPMFDKSPHSLDKSYPAFDATPSFDHRNTQSTNGSCGVGEHLFDRESWNDMQVSPAKSMKLRDQQMIKAEFVNQ